MRCQTVQCPFRGPACNDPSRVGAYHHFRGGYDYLFERYFNRGKPRLLRRLLRGRTEMAELLRKENMITQDGLFSLIRVQYKDTDRSRIRSRRIGHRKGEDQ